MAVVGRERHQQDEQEESANPLVCHILITR